MLSSSLLNYIKRLPKHSYTKFYLLTPVKTKKMRTQAIKAFLDSTRSNEKSKSKSKSK